MPMTRQQRAEQLARNKVKEWLACAGCILLVQFFAVVIFYALTGGWK